MSRTRPRVQAKAMTREEQVRAHTLFTRAYAELIRRGKSHDAAYRAAYLKGYGKARFRIKTGGDPLKKDRELAKIRVPFPKLTKPPRRTKN